MKKCYVYFCFIAIISFFFGGAYAENTKNCQYAPISTVLKEACGGIKTELEQLKKRGTVNTLVTGVGTGAAGGALYAGIQKSKLDAQAKKIQQEMDRIESMSDREFFYFLKNITAYEEERTKYNNLCSQKKELEARSKKMGNVRTGLMVGNTATAVAGTIMASKNKNEAHDINQMIQNCLNTIANNKLKVGQTMIDCNQSEYEKLKNAVSECGNMYSENMTKAEKNSKAASVASAINIGTGTVGAITSAAANTDKNDADKKQNLNKAANLFAGTSMVASGTATVFNVLSTKAIKDNLDASTRCQEALDEL